MGYPFGALNRLATFGTLPQKDWWKWCFCYSGKGPRQWHGFHQLHLCKAGRGKPMLFTFSARFGTWSVLDVWSHSLPHFQYVLYFCQGHGSYPGNTPWMRYKCITEQPNIHTFILANPTTIPPFVEGVGKKLENLEETHPDMRRTWTKTQDLD